MRIFLTGGLGFLGSHLVRSLLKQDNKLILLIRPLKNKSALQRAREKFGDEIVKDIEIIEGDLDNIWVPSQLCNYTKPIDKVIHIAALLDLGEGRKDEIWKTNVEGTENILAFCAHYEIPHLVFVSTAYTLGRNFYELSKAKCEEEIKESGINYTIIKPSVIIGSPSDPGPSQAINHVALTIVKLHKKAETTRLKIQNGLALPPLELGFRLKGESKASLSVIPINLVVDKIIDLINNEGTYYITNPNPPSVQEVANELGEALSLNIHILKKFKHSPPEKILERVIKPFLTYMQGEPEFPTVIDKGFRVEKEYIRDTVKSFLDEI